MLKDRYLSEMMFRVGGFSCIAVDGGGGGWSHCLRKVVIQLKMQGTGKIIFHVLAFFCNTFIRKLYIKARQPH